MNESPKPSRDKWVIVATSIVALLYAYLLQLHPSGEGFGRGWNVIAFLIYGSPAAWLAAGVAFWRTARTSGAIKKLAVAAAWLGFAFPLIAFVVMRART